MNKIFRQGKLNMIQKKSKRGVTLIALVITIVVVFIIAGISISPITGQMNGITKGEETKTEVNVDEERILEKGNSDSGGRADSVGLVVCAELFPV